MSEMHIFNLLIMIQCKC